MQQDTPKRSLLRRWEWILFLLALAVLLYFVLQHVGLSPVDVTEDTRLIDQPHR